ncbi:predicted protein [Chaetoceros tenuissimus]|uniref:Uncharacterized protein n=1 Tax=Chaetoceros tenuissimus TaxID=426638 RepID=A0AAD3CNS1_9STRA|nr:predicted protein [Chaetoceros tenuissimus]
MPNGSFNVVSQGTENANDASTYRHDATRASDNSGRRGGTSLGNSQRSQTGRDSKRNQSSVSVQSLQTPKRNVEIIGTLLLGIAAYLFGSLVIGDAESFETGGDSKSDGSFRSFIESKSLIEIVGILLLGLATSLYSLVVTAASTLFGSRKVPASTSENQRMVDILDDNGLTGSKVVIEDPQLSNLSDLVLIQHYPYENRECKGLIDGESKDRSESTISFKEILSLIPRILFPAELEIH